MQLNFLIILCTYQCIIDLIYMFIVFNHNKNTNSIELTHSEKKLIKKLLLQRILYII